MKFPKEIVFIRISPSDQFSIDFEIEFDSHLVNKQACQLQLVNGNYKKDISGARTFGFEKNVNELRAKRDLPWAEVLKML